MKKAILFYGFLVCCLFVFAPTSVFAYDETKVEKEIYPFMTEDGVIINSVTLISYDTEQFLIEEADRNQSHRMNDYRLNSPRTYRLVEKKTREDVAHSSYSHEKFFLYDGDIYYIKDQVIYTNYFLHLGADAELNHYWIYFGKDGKMVKDTVIDGAFIIDKNGLFHYQESDLYKRLVDKYTKELTESGQYLFDNEENRQAYKKEGYTKKKIDALIQKQIADYVKDSLESRLPSKEMVSGLINKAWCVELGSWVPYGEAPEYETVEVEGARFETTKDGKLRCYVDSITRVERLHPITPRMLIQRYNGYDYDSDDTYEWRKTILAENEYLSDIQVEIDGDLYYFDENGYAIKNQWHESYFLFYFGKDGKAIRNSWVARDGELCYVDEQGRVETNTWIEDKTGRLFVTGDGTIDYGQTEKEYEIYNKILKFRDRPDKPEKIGICSTFVDILVQQLFGKEAKGTRYTYDWDKIKIGDTIAGDNHIVVVMRKTDDAIYVAESNWDGDLTEHYLRDAFFKENLDELMKKGKMYYQFTTYYSAEPKDASMFKPDKPTLSTKRTGNTVTLSFTETKGAVGFTIYMSQKKNSGYKAIKTVKAEDALTYQKTKLANGTYYFKVRAYRMVDGEKIWGDYSNVVKCTVKK